MESRELVGATYCVCVGIGALLITENIRQAVTSASAAETQTRTGVLTFLE